MSKNKPKEHQFPEGAAEHIQNYIWAIITFLGAAHWDAYLVTTVEEDATASIRPLEGTWQAEIRLSRDWLTKRTPEQKRSDLVHEILHLHHQGITNVTAIGLLRSTKAGEAEQLAWRLIRNEAEQMVDALTRAIAPYAPEWVDQFSHQVTE